MQIHYVKELRPFQRLIVTICSVMRMNGYDSDDVTVDRVARITSTVPRAKKALIACQWEINWPESERKRVTDIVRENMKFFEQRIFIFGNLMDIENVEKAEPEEVVLDGTSDG